METVTQLKILFTHIRREKKKKKATVSGGATRLRLDDERQGEMDVW